MRLHQLRAPAATCLANRHIYVTNTKPHQTGSLEHDTSSCVHDQRPQTPDPGDNTALLR